MATLHGKPPCPQVDVSHSSGVENHDFASVVYSVLDGKLTIVLQKRKDNGQWDAVSERVLSSIPA